ncbi:zinc-finger homeodomain protein 3-like [Pyrus ussuriensis x Pyrus communis]|uniref:Zinc-finger homeodomain protein 3-like n=1 Tax=Pyrus ussuriensis x Pyrus communis TaxID=2448454 RepID=A0A5N5HYV6_9ROSA|nr:zinc-finger homeodomain protein 3-like [Pyrus ussuriensis x Pyrus communis]
MQQSYEGLLRMAVLNSCLMEKKAPSKPLRALTALLAITTEKKSKVSHNSIFPLGIIISIIPSIGRLELGA